MSEEKLYAVKNDEGEWMSLDGPQTEIWYSNNPTLFKDKSYAEAQSMGRKAHVVELVDHGKVVLTKEQAEIVENACYEEYPATYICGHTGDEEDLLINAYVNGYTVEKEKKYGVWVPHVKGKMYYKDGRGSDYLDIASAYFLNDKNQQFTEAEIEHYGLQDCEKEDVTDDMPVIPKAVSEYIQWGKSYDIQLYMMYVSQLIHRPGFKKLTDDAKSWIISSSNIFARAWLLGVWRVEETGEIVKLEVK